MGTTSMVEPTRPNIVFAFADDWGRDASAGKVVRVWFEAAAEEQALFNPPPSKRST